MRSKQMLWIKAMQHLQAGAELVHGDSCLSPLRGESDLYELSMQGVTTTHSHIMDAIDAFALGVGTGGLRQAILTSRYKVLFPIGSSLEWAAAPLTVWNRPAQWLKAAG